MPNKRERKTNRDLAKSEGLYGGRKIALTINSVIFAIIVSLNDFLNFFIADIKVPTYFYSIL